LSLSSLGARAMINNMVEILNWQPPADGVDFSRVRGVIIGGGIVGLPTETYYALAVDALNEAALARLAALKGRPEDRPFLVLVADRAMVEQVAAGISPLAETLMERFWPGPLTLILPARPGLSRWLTADTGTIGVRLSSHPGARLLPALCGVPLTGTSANRSGTPPLRTAAEMEREFGREVDLIVAGPPCPGGPPSTLLDLTQNAPRLVRVGAVSREALRPFLGEAADNC